MKLEQHYKTIVIGAGPAGVMAAVHASSVGSVLLVESMKLPRVKSCGGMLNEYSQRFLASSQGLPKSLITEPEWINFRFFDWDRDIRKATTLRFQNVDRKAFDEWLTNLLPSNVTVADNTRYISSEQKGTTVLVKLRTADDTNASVQEVASDYLVGCDGPRSSVRKDLPISQLTLYKTLQDFITLEGEMEPYFDCLYSRNIGKDYGYGYLIPKGEQAIIGSVFFPGSKNCLDLHKKAVDVYRSYFPYAKEVLRREAWTAVKVESVDDIPGGYGRILLAGEAGGIMSPSSGEGISFAMNSGKFAGQAIAEAVKQETKNDPADESQALKAYRIALKPIRNNIARRLVYFKILNTNWGKWLGGSSPNAIVDKVAHII